VYVPGWVTFKTVSVNVEINGVFPVFGVKVGVANRLLAYWIDKETGCAFLPFAAVTVTPTLVALP
jgi:hypothetical protein